MTATQHTRSVRTLALAGAMIIIAGTFLPMLRLPLIGSWHFWQLDVRLAGIVTAFAGVAILAAFAGRASLMRFCAWAVLAMLVLTYIAVFFKVHQAFGGFLFRKLHLTSAASRLVRYRSWGWMVQGIGAVVVLIGSKTPRGADIRTETTP